MIENLHAFFMSAVLFMSAVNALIMKAEESMDLLQSIKFFPVLNKI